MTLADELENKKIKKPDPRAEGALLYNATLDEIIPKVRVLEAERFAYAKRLEAAYVVLADENNPDYQQALRFLKAVIAELEGKAKQG